MQSKIKDFVLTKYAQSVIDNSSYKEGEELAHSIFEKLLDNLTLEELEQD